MVKTKPEIDRIEMPDPQAINPYYRGARMSGVARARKGRDEK